MRALYLHTTLTKDTTALAAHLETWIALDVEALAAAVDEPSLLDAGESERIWRTLRLIAALQEKFPSRKWSENTKVADALERARRSDSADMERLRRQDWTRTFLERGMSSDRP
jgi:hypothetical protein